MGIRIWQGISTTIGTQPRPERSNAINKRFMAELGMALDDVESDPEIRCMVFTGAPRPDGRPCFSIGRNLESAQTSATEHQVGICYNITGMTPSRGQSLFGRSL